MLEAWPHHLDVTPENQRTGSGIHVFSSPRKVKP